MSRAPHDIELDQLREQNPFVSGVTEFGGRRWPTQAMDVGSRLDALKTFNQEECRAALRLPVQKTVRAALERRLRKLDKESG